MALKRLEAQGLVTRHRASDNKSRMLVSLTEAGSALRTRAAGIPRALSCALDRPDEDANRELLQPLQELTAAAQAGEPPLPERFPCLVSGTVGDTSGHGSLCNVRV